MIDLNNSATARSREEMQRKKNKPDFEDGFGLDEDGGFGFDQLDSDFSSFGTSGSNDSTFQQDPFGSNQQSQWGQPSQLPGMQPNQIVGNSFANPFGQNMPPQQPPQKQPDAWDAVREFSGNGFVVTGKILKECVLSLPNRTAVDGGYYFRTSLIAGLGVLGLGILCLIIGAASGNPFVSQGLGYNFIVQGVWIAGLSAAAMLGIAFVLTNFPPRERIDINKLPVNEGTEADCSDDAEDSMDEIWSTLMGSDDIDLTEDESSDFNPSAFMEDEFSAYTPEPQEAEEFDLEKIPERQVINRAMLVDTFTRFLPLNEPNFAEKKPIEKDSDTFEALEANCMQALSIVMRKSFEEIDSELNSATDGFFAYEMRMKRPRAFKSTQLTEIAREVEIYLRESAEQTEVIASAVLERDEIKITVLKGTKAVVTVGDVMRVKEVEEFIRNEKKKLPFPAGITSEGKVIMEDAAVLDSMMISGQSRSGKSWYIFNLILNLCLWNSPDDVVFIVVDPKDANLMNKLGLIPHVIGVHNNMKGKLLADYMLDILDELINEEGNKRKKQLADAGVDDIWEFKKRMPNVSMPVIFLMIDEVVSLKASMGEVRAKEFNAKVQQIITQLPFVGIRIILIPHRATGVVDKMVRQQMKFFAAIRATEADIKDTLDVKSWDTPLVNQGDTAMLGSDRKPVFVRGTAMATSDPELAELIENIAKAFYKLGVPPTRTGYLRVCHNQNVAEIRKKLQADDIEQFDSNEFKKQHYQSPTPEYKSSMEIDEEKLPVVGFLAEEDAEPITPEFRLDDDSLNVEELPFEDWGLDKDDSDNIESGSGDSTEMELENDLDSLFGV
jgi:S-DNA-T family DNA segregation ATPase FtsK/SpoIIIE